jgi:two-component system OmpR family response regulator
MSRILIVDDDVLLLATLESMLVDEGFDVVAVDGGRKAVSMLESAPFDAVIVDMVMPGMDGYQTIREFRRISPTTPIIAMSGVAFHSASRGTPDFTAMAMKLGATRILHKPFDQTRLGSAVRACLR